MILDLIKNSNLTEKQLIIDFYNNKQEWYGCFGVQSIISLSFIEKLQQKYNFLSLVNIINNRNLRMQIERLFAVLCTIEQLDLKNSPSMFGIIHDYIPWKYSYKNYKKNKNSKFIQSKQLIRVWSGR